MSEGNKNNIRNINRFDKIAPILNRYFYLLAVLLFAVLIMAGYFFLIEDKYRGLVKLKKDDLAKVNNDINYLLSNKDDFMDYVKQMTVFSQEEENLLNLALPNGLDVPSIIIQVDELARTHGFQIVKIDIDEASNSSSNISVPSNKDIKKVNINVEFSGDSYESWKRLVASIESSIMIFDVTAMSFSGDGSFYRLNMNSYFYPSSN